MSLVLTGADRVVSDKSSLKRSMYDGTTLRSRKKVKGNITGEKTLVSRTAIKEAMPALEMASKYIYTVVGVEKAILLVPYSKKQDTNYIYGSKEL